MEIPQDLPNPRSIRNGFSLFGRFRHALLAMERVSVSNKSSYGLYPSVDKRGHEVHIMTLMLLLYNNLNAYPQIRALVHT